MGVQGRPTPIMSDLLKEKFRHRCTTNRHVKMKAEIGVMQQRSRKSSVIASKPPEARIETWSILFHTLLQH